jgi:hypothetical protein
MINGVDPSALPPDLRPVPETPEGRLAAASDYRTPDPGARPIIGRQTLVSTRGLGGERGTTSQARRPDWLYCPDSALHSHDEGSRRDGCCTWCGHKFKAKAQRPNFGTSYPTDLDREYRRTYDPDYGTDYWDS